MQLYFQFQIYIYIYVCVCVCVCFHGTHEDKINFSKTSLYVDSREAYIELLNSSGKY